MGGACSEHGGEESRLHGFGGKSEGKRPLVRPRYRWEDNIKIDLLEVACGLWTGSSWLRTGRNGGRLCMR